MYWRRLCASLPASQVGNTTIHYQIAPHNRFRGRMHCQLLCNFMKNISHAGLLMWLLVVSRVMWTVTDWFTGNRLRAVIRQWLFSQEIEFMVAQRAVDLLVMCKRLCTCLRECLWYCFVAFWLCTKSAAPQTLIYNTVKLPCCQWPHKTSWHE